jgi:hypothetical protein
VISVERPALSLPFRRDLAVPLKQQSRRCHGADGFALANNRPRASPCALRIEPRIERSGLGRDQESISLSRLASSFIVRLLNSKNRQVRRRFPTPWSVEEKAACFTVKDSNGQKLAYAYFEEEPGAALRG